MLKSAKGFTLVELLVVIALIAILSSIGVAVYSGVQKQARISRRMQDLKAIQTALEVYYQSNKAYPNTSSNWSSECTGTLASNVILGLVPNYMLSFPADPSMNNNTSCYRYKSNGADYKLQDTPTEMTSTDFQTQKSLIDTAADGADCSKVDGTPTAWAVYSSNTGVADNNTNPACWN